MSTVDTADKGQPRAETLAQLHRIVRNTRNAHSCESAIIAMAVRLEAAARLEGRYGLDHRLIVRAGGRRFVALQRLVYGGAR